MVAGFFSSDLCYNTYGYYNNQSSNSYATYESPNATSIFQGDKYRNYAEGYAAGYADSHQNVSFGSQQNSVNEDTDVAVETAEDEEIPEERKEAKISDKNAKNASKNIRAAISDRNIEKLSTYINSPDIPDVDKIKIFSILAEEIGSFSSEVFNVVGEHGKKDDPKIKDLIDKYMEICVKEAKAGNEDAIALISKELTTQAQGEGFYSEEYDIYITHPYESFFKYADNDVIMAVDNYMDENLNRTLYEQVELFQSCINELPDFNSYEYIINNSPTIISYNPIINPLFIDDKNDLYLMVDKNEVNNEAENYKQAILIADCAE